MIRKITTIALLGAALISSTACNSGGAFKKYKGIEYKIVKHVDGKTAQIGDIVEFHIVAKVDTMVLADSRKQQNGKPAVIKVEEPKGIGQFQAVFTKLSAGDSAVVEISCDTMLKANPPQQGMQLPPWLKKGKKIVVTLSIVSIKSMDDYKKEMDQKANMQAQSDDKTLQDYFAKNNIKPTKTASGLYYTITKPGAGENVKPGQMATMNYIGKTLEGKQFDANVDENFQAIKDRTPFTFPVGAGQVIKGWDEGVQLLNKGSKAVLYIPSPLAYGAQSPSPDLAANSILVFNVEVTDIKDAPKNAPGQGGPQGQAPNQQGQGQ